jgi:hypothetical protein
VKAHTSPVLVVVQFAQKQSHALSFRSQVHRRGICLLPAARQQVPRATIPRLGMTILMGFSNGAAIRAFNDLIFDLNVVIWCFLPRLSPLKEIKDFQPERGLFRCRAEV